MNHFAEIFLDLFVVFVAAQVGAEISQRLKLPAVVGEIAAGSIVGASVLGWVHINEPLEVLAEIGVILLLFSVGLETRLDDLGKVGRVAVLAGVGGESAQESRLCADLRERAEPGHLDERRTDFLTSAE